MESLEAGQRSRDYIAIWPRGGAKSTTVELAVARLEATGRRRFVLYVSETQAMANKHVQAIASLLERLGVERSINQYGISRGWKVDMLRTASGFNVLALGLDAGSRGIKLDEFRPDLIVLDDIDGLHDSADITAKKEEIITNTVLPTGSIDAAVIFVQNRISEFSLMSRIADGEADWLREREPISEEPAIVGLEVEEYAGEDGIKRWRITAGEPTWQGQGLEECERAINRFGLKAFLREAQHAVKGAQGYVFDADQLHVIEPHQVPKGLRWCRAWDLAATEGGGDHTTGWLLGMRGTYPTVEAYLVHAEFGQWGTEKVRTTIRQRAGKDPRGTRLRLPKDPSQAGVFQVNQLARDLAEFAPVFRPVTTKKAIRARGFAECVNLGNCYVVRGPWVDPLRREMRQFREDEKHESDDHIDACADAFNEMALHPEPTEEEKRRDYLQDQSWLPSALRTEKTAFTDGLDDAPHSGPVSLDSLYD